VVAAASPAVFTAPKGQTQKELPGCARPWPHARQVAELIAPIESEYVLAPQSVQDAEGGVVP
jgi:hypothetical protein